MSPALRVAIVGGGTMGLAAAWALARRGAAVELFERFDHIHEQGSHGGHTRVIRHAYHEGSDYVDLVSRADREWTALGARAGETLLVRSGLLEFGPPHDPEFAAARQALREHGIPHQLMSAAQARSRYPFRVPDQWEACLSPQSGYLRVRPCLDALRREAEEAGARLRYRCGVRELIPSSGGGPGLRLDDGAVVVADRLVIAAGAWSQALLTQAGQALPRPLQVQRRVLAWTRAALPDLPTWAAFTPEGFFYGFPPNDEGASPDTQGCKLACHVASDPSLAWMNEGCDPDEVDRRVHERDLEPLRRFLDRYVEAEVGGLAASKTCLYTNTPSGDFWLDRHPQDERIAIAAGFSGHGFKFAPAIGQILADLSIDGHSALNLPRFSQR